MVDAHLDAHYDAHLAHRTTVGVWGSCWKQQKEGDVGLDNEQAGGDSAPRSSSSVVRPAHLYLASNLECSVKPRTIPPSPLSVPSLPQFHQ